MFCFICLVLNFICISHIRVRWVWNSLISLIISAFFLARNSMQWHRQKTNQQTHNRKEQVWSANRIKKKNAKYAHKMKSHAIQNRLIAKSHVSIISLAYIYLFPFVYLCTTFTKQMIIITFWYVFKLLMICFFFIRAACMNFIDFQFQYKRRRRTKPNKMACKYSVRNNK